MSPRYCKKNPKPLVAYYIALFALLSIILKNIIVDPLAGTFNSGNLSQAAVFH